MLLSGNCTNMPSGVCMSCEQTECVVHVASIKAVAVAWGKRAREAASRRAGPSRASFWDGAYVVVVHFKAGL